MGYYDTLFDLCVVGQEFISDDEDEDDEDDDDNRE